jgi:hypothetical protein
MDEQVSIGGTFDVALARQRLRKLADAHNWPNLLRVRATAALTALVEVLYFRRINPQDALHIIISVLPAGKPGVEFHIEAPFTEICTRYAVARWQIERACDELVVQSNSGLEHVTVKVWYGEIVR